MELRKYQQEAREAVENEWENGNNRTLLVLPTGCHKKGECVLMADGSIKAVQDVLIGDELMGDDGQSRTVLHLTSGTDMIYKVTPIKGKPLYVTGDHKLTLVRTNEKSIPKYPSQKKGGEFVDVTVNEWLTWPKWRKHIFKLVRSEEIHSFPNYYSPSEKLIIDPYFLGIMLGDGGLTVNINVTTMEKEVVKELLRQAEKREMRLKTEPAGKAFTYSFVDKVPHGRGGNSLANELKQIGISKCDSGSKFVPDDYKFADIHTRLEVLAGLLDSDGYLYGGNLYDFVTKSKQLFDDTCFIARSCGLAAYGGPCQKSCNGFTGTYWRLTISGDCEKIPCRVERRKAHPRLQKKSVLRTGFSITEYGNHEYFGFTVDGDNRYLMDDFTITHNCGKTVVFAKITEDRVRTGDRVLILAHRGELLEQASDKIKKVTGLNCSVEKAEQSSLDSFYRVTVGSVQTLMREKRLAMFSPDHFDTIIIDEAHHCISDSYQKILEYFKEAKVLGVTATPDRGDMKDLGAVFDSLAYEYSIVSAIKEGYLAPIKALTLPLKLDLSGVSIQAGDFKASDIDSALDPYLHQIAEEMLKYCKDRKTVVFLPLVKTSQKFRDILNEKGFRAGEVNGNSQDRAEILKDFEDGKYNVLCNSMLLTEGWDCPSVDCVIVLRPTKVRSLYCQMVGRGTRPCKGKDHLLLLDFLWHTERHELCHPAALICERQDVAKKMTENIKAAAGCPVDIEEAAEQAESDVVVEREEALAKQLEEMRKRKKKLVDPLQFEMSIQSEDLSGYVPAFGWEAKEPSKKQLKDIEDFGVNPDGIDSAGKAEKLLQNLRGRRTEGLATPKQIRFLEGKGFLHVGTWRFDSAKNLINRIAANNWRVPAGINPGSYKPVAEDINIEFSTAV